MSRNVRLGLFLLHALFGLFFIHSGVHALRTGDASGMYIDDRPVETESEMRSFVYWGLYANARGVAMLFVPLDECRAEGEEEEDGTTESRTPSASSGTFVGLVRLAFLVTPPRGGCEKDDPWPLLG